MGRFTKYASSDFPELWKLEVGEERTVKLLGMREYDGKDGEVPVLDLEDYPGGGEPFSYMAGPWRARAALAALDPPDGSVLLIKRLADIGQSHDIEIAFAGPDADAPQF
jgi:hypothetical protein